MEEYQSVLDTPSYKLMKIAVHAANQYYNHRTAKHANRVANYILENSAIPEDIRSECTAVALMHDLIEDTNEFNIGCNGRPAKLYRFKDDIKEIDIF